MQFCHTPEPILESNSFLVMTHTDRTNEFFSIAESLNAVQQKDAPVVLNRSAKSEFARAAAAIGSDIHGATQKLEKLTKLAKKKSLFDDHATEINELTLILKQDIAGLNQKLGGAQQLLDQQKQKKQFHDHSESVVSSLKQSLMRATTDFKQVLQLRTESMQAQQSRRSQFSSSSAQSPNYANTSLYLQRQRPALSSPGGGGAGDDVVIEMEESQPLMMNAQLSTESYLNTRTQAVDSVQSTIVELGDIFQQLATMVAEQGEMANIIDNNVDDSLIQVEEGQKQILKYWHNVSSNRTLIMRIFLVMIFFMIFFGLFIA